MIKIRAGLSDIYAQAYQGKSEVAKKYREYTERINSDRLSRDEKCKLLAERQIMGGMIRELVYLEKMIRGKRIPGYILNLMAVERYRWIARLTPKQEEVIEAVISAAKVEMPNDGKIPLHQKVKITQRKIAHKLGMTQENVSTHIARAHKKIKRAKELCEQGCRIGLSGEKLIAYVRMNDRQRMVYELILDGKKNGEIAELTGLPLSAVKVFKSEINTILKKVSENVYNDFYGCLMPNLGQISVKERMPLNQTKGHQTKCHLNNT